MVGGYRSTSFTGTSFTTRELVVVTSTERFDVRSTIAERLGTFKFNIRQIAHENSSFTSASFDTDTFLNTDITTADKTFNFDIRAGSINAHIISHFLLTGGVVRTLTSNITIVGEIMKTLTVRVGLLQTVSNILRNRFDLRQALTKTSTNRFNITTIVGKLGSYLNTSFTTSSYNISDLSKRFNFSVREGVTETTTGKFNIIQEITKTLSNLFDIRTVIPVRTLTTRFGIRNIMSSLGSYLDTSFTNTFTLSGTRKAFIFNVIGQATSTLTNRFRITTTVPVRTLTNQFIIRQAVSDTLTVLVGLHQAITRLLTNRFDIRQIIFGLPSFIATGFTSDSFTLTAGTIPQLTSRFNLLSGLAGVLGTFRFDVRELVADTVQSRFDIRQAITDILSIRIGLAHQLSKNLTTIFNLRQAILETDTARFDIREKLSKTVTAPFIIRHLISDVLTGRFDLRQAITGIVTTRFDMQKIATNILRVKFHIKFLLTNTRRVSTRSSSKRVGTTGSSRNVKSL